MTEFWNYCKYKMSKLFRRQTILNFQVFYFISFLLAVYGAKSNPIDWPVIILGLLILIFTSIYHDYADGRWKYEMRKGYDRLTRRDLKVLKEKEEEKIEEIKDGGTE